MEATEDDLDTHMCLSCETTIVGLDNYIRHKKLECPHRKGAVKKPLTGPTATHQTTPMTVDVQEVGHLHPASHMSPSTSGIVNPDVVLGSTSKFHEFISSLALQSRSNLQDDKATEKRPNDLDLMDLGNDRLPNLLSLNLDFSSDSDPDLSEYLKDSDDDYYPPENHTGGKWKPSPESTGGKWRSPESTGGKWKPPETHTGGKWKPGTRPPRGHTGGKWKPGMGPRPIGRKRARNMSGDDAEEEEDDDDADSMRNDDGDTGVDSHPEDENIASSREYGTGGKVRRTGGKVFKNLVKECEMGGKTPAALSKEDEIESQEVESRNIEDIECESAEKASEEDHVTSIIDDSMGSKSNAIEESVDQKDETVETSALDAENSAANTDETESSEGHYCQICKDKFYNQYTMARHLLTQFHYNRAKGHPEAVPLFEKYHHLILRLSPFQCSSCKFYCNSNDDLKLHLGTDYHVLNTADLLGPQLCTLCRFMTDKNDEMVEHIGSEEHIAQANELTRKRPCVIRENRKTVDCKVCGHTSHSVTMLKKHIQAKHKNSEDVKKRVNRSCEHCNKTFSSRVTLGIHIRRRHTKERPFTCDSCQKSYADKYTLQLHMNSKAHMMTVSKLAEVEYVPPVPPAETAPKKTHGKASPVYYCEFCDFKTSKYTDLRPHFIKEHPRKAKTCKNCAVTMYRTADFKNHLETKRHKTLAKLAEESGDKVFKCRTCERIFEREKNLMLHVLSHHATESSKELNLKMKEKHKDFLSRLPKHGSKKSVVSCPECHKEIKRIGIRQHLLTHISMPQKCITCSKSFMSVATLKRHIASAHVDVQPLVCEECGKRFVKSYSYRQHVATVHRNAPKTFVCDICGHAFSSKWQLTHHSKIHGQKHLKCSFEGCCLTFRSRSDMIIHLRTHTNERPFLCDQCGYRGKSQNQLTRHHRTHTGERNYSCEYCPYKALNSTHLRRHMRVHIGSKPYKCPYCSYACNTHENIRKHIIKTKKHAGLKIYVCKFCKFGTNCSKTFRDHVTSDHPDEIKDKTLDLVSEFSGLYQREGDPKAPLEGSQVLPVRERKKRKVAKNPRKKVSEKIAALEQKNSDMTEGVTHTYGAALCIPVSAALGNVPMAGMKGEQLSNVQELKDGSYTCTHVPLPVMDRGKGSVSQVVATVMTPLPSASTLLQPTSKIDTLPLPNEVVSHNVCLVPIAVDSDKSHGSEHVGLQGGLGGNPRLLGPSTTLSTSAMASSAPVTLRALLNSDAFLGLPGKFDSVLSSGMCRQNSSVMMPVPHPADSMQVGTLTLPLYVPGNQNTSPSLSDLANPNLKHLVSLHQLATYPKDIILTFIENVRKAAPDLAHLRTDQKDLSISLSLVEKARTPNSLVPIHHLLGTPNEFLSILLDIAKAKNKTVAEGDEVGSDARGEDSDPVYETLQPIVASYHRTSSAPTSLGVSLLAKDSTGITTSLDVGQNITSQDQVASEQAAIVEESKQSLQTTSTADIMLEMAEVVLSSCTASDKPSDKDQMYAGQTYPSVHDLEPSESMAIQLLSNLAQGGISSTTSLRDSNN